MTTRFHYLIPIRSREPRMNRTDRLRKRTRGRRGYCGCDLPVSDMTRDHVIPRAHGGETKEANLLACCKGCNQRKADMDVEDFRDLYFGGGVFWVEIVEEGLA